MRGKMKTNSNDLVYRDTITTAVDPNADRYTFISGGLTKREHFAAIAMQGMLAHDHWRGGSQSGKYKTDLAEYAVSFADALIAELNKRSEP